MTLEGSAVGGLEGNHMHRRMHDAIYNAHFRYMHVMCIGACGLSIHNAVCIPSCGAMGISGYNQGQSQRLGTCNLTFLF